MFNILNLISYLCLSLVSVMASTNVDDANYNDHNKIASSTIKPVLNTQKKSNLIKNYPKIRDSEQIDIVAFLNTPFIISSGKKYYVNIEENLKKELIKETDWVVRKVKEEIQQLEKSQFFDEVVGFSFELDDDQLYVIPYAGKNAW